MLHGVGTARVARIDIIKARVWRLGRRYKFVVLIERAAVRFVILCQFLDVRIFHLGRRVGLGLGALGPECTVRSFVVVGSALKFARSLDSQDTGGVEGCAHAALQEKRVGRVRIVVAKCDLAQTPVVLNSTPRYLWVLLWRLLLCVPEGLGKLLHRRWLVLEVGVALQHGHKRQRLVWDAVNNLGVFRVLDYRATLAAFEKLRIELATFEEDVKQSFGLSGVPLLYDRHLLRRPCAI